MVLATVPRVMTIVVLSLESLILAAMVHIVWPPSGKMFPLQACTTPMLTVGGSHFTPPLGLTAMSSGLLAKKTPQPLLEKINATLQKVNASQAVQARYVATGFEPIRQERTLEQLSTDLQAEYQRNGEIVKSFGIKLN